MPLDVANISTAGRCSGFRQVSDKQGRHAARPQRHGDYDDGAEDLLMPIWKASPARADRFLGVG